MTINLYHGTSQDSYEGIFEMGYLLPGSALDGLLDESKQDKVLDEIVGENNKRTGCIYFYDTKDYTIAHSKTLSVNIADLDQDKLFVADMMLAQDIYLESSKSNIDTEKVKDLVKKYNNTLVPYSIYEEEGSKLFSEDNAEYLYYGNISAENIKVVKNNSFL